MEYQAHFRGHQMPSDRPLPRERPERRCRENVHAQLRWIFQTRQTHLRGSRHEK